VIGTWYEEILVKHLSGGKIQLNQALRSLIEAAESIRELDRTKRKRTILRIDSGGAEWTTSTGSWSEAIRCIASNFSVVPSRGGQVKTVHLFGYQKLVRILLK
jgi:hypothetical protein